MSDLGYADKRRRHQRKGEHCMARKMEIVFFDDLGFGWVMDAAEIEHIREKQTIEQILIRRSLAELLRKSRPI